MITSSSLPVATVRTERRYAPWSTLYLDQAQGSGVLDTGHCVRLRPGASVAKVLGALPPSVRRVYLVGRLPNAYGDKDPDKRRAQSDSNDSSDLADPDERRLNGFLAWGLDLPSRPNLPGELETTSSALEHRWAEDPERRHWLDGEASVLRYLRREDGRHVELRPLTAWFGDLLCTPEQAQQAMTLLGLRVAEEWHGAILLATPAQTGLDLWLRGIPPDKAYPILPDDVQALIHHTSGQARIELLPPPPGVEHVSTLFYFDARWAYAASCRGVGAGPVTRDSVPDYLPYHPARYRLRYRVPVGWGHVGVFMAPAHDGRTWCYPCAPGAVGETWADGQEVALALWPFPHTCERCRTLRTAGTLGGCPEHGWAVDIYERLLFTKLPRGPLDTWAEKLIALRATVERAGHDGRWPTHVVHLASVAVKALLVDALGGFARSRRPVQRLAVEGQADCIPAGTRHVRIVQAGGHMAYLWHEPARVPENDPSFLSFQHPEFASQVWAGCRARILVQHHGAGGPVSGLLTVPREQVVAVRTDGVYLTHAPTAPGWDDVDDGRPGRLRLKATLRHEGVAWPRTSRALGQLKAAMTPASAPPACCQPPESAGGDR